MKTYSMIILCIFSIFLAAHAYAQNPDSDSDANANIPQEVQGLQQSMMSDQQIMDMIVALQHDPDFIKALNDPDIMKAIDENDYPALIKNPDFMKLLENETVRRIQEELDQNK